MHQRARDDVTKHPEIRFGILGAARIAPAALIRPARQVEGVRVVAVAARDRARSTEFARRHGIDTVHGSYGDLLDDPDVDAVYIPLPNGLHGAWTMRAIAAGKHVLCEKPFAANATEAQHVARAAHASDRIVAEAFHWRYHPLNQRLLASLERGAIGALQRVDATFCVPLLDRHDIRWSRTLAGGSLMDLGCYPVNMVRAVLHAVDGGEPEVVDATAHFTPRGVDRSLTARLRWGNGVEGSIRCGMFSPTHPIGLRLRVIGTNGSFLVRNPVAPQIFGHLVSRVDGRRRITFAERTPSYVGQLEAFRDAVVDGAPFPSTVDDAVANMTVIDAIYRATGIVAHDPTPTDD